MKGIVTTSALAGAAASLCCVGPALVVLGASTTLSMFSFLEPVRPFTSFFAIGLLGIAHVQVHRKKKEAECCDIDQEATMKRVKSQRRAVWGLSPVVLALVLFPYAGSTLYAGADKNSDTAGLAQAEWTIEGLTCVWCARGLEAGMNRVDGVSSCTVDYSSKSMSLKFDKRVINEQAVSEMVKKLGYAAVLTDKKQDRENTKSSRSSQ